MLVLIMSLYANYKSALAAHEGHKARLAVEKNGED